MIDRLTVERIMTAQNIVDVIGDFYHLSRKGKEYQCLCPFHDDRHIGSFSVSPVKNIFHCFSCGAHGNSVEFLMRHERLSYPDALRWLGRKYGIEVEGSERFTPKPSTPRTPPPPLQMLTLPLSMVKATMHLEDDNLVKWLRSFNWDGAQEARIDKVLNTYMVGHTNKGHYGKPLNDGFPGFTVFWQIDDLARVRTAKMIRYKADGHRLKPDELKYNSDWIHSRLEKAGKFDPEQYNAVTTLFGLHLLDMAPNATVNIVESEKTALFMSIAYGGMGQQIWMASGGKTMLNRTKLKPIIDRQRYIILYPDHDAISEWQEIAKMIDYSRLRVNTDFININWREEDGQKADIADILARIIGPRRSKAIQQVGTVLQALIDKNPALKMLIEKFDLQEDGRNKTEQ